MTCTRAASLPLKISSRLRDPRTRRPGSRSDRPRPELPLRRPGRRLANLGPGRDLPWPCPALAAPPGPGAARGPTRRVDSQAPSPGPGSESRARRRRGCRGGHLGPPGRLRRLRLNYAARGFESRVSTEDAAAAASHESLMLRPLAAARQCRGRQCRCRSPGPRRRPTVGASGPARPREKESKVSWEAAA